LIRIGRKESAFAGRGQLLQQLALPSAVDMLVVVERDDQEDAGHQDREQRQRQQGRQQHRKLDSAASHAAPSKRNSCACRVATWQSTLSMGSGSIP